MRSDEANKLIGKVNQFIVESFDEGHHSVYHLQRTVYWLQRLKPDADATLVIAALAHDLQRSEQSNPLLLGKEKVKILEQTFLDYHQQRGAEIIGAFLRECKADETFVRRVEELVRHHEVGGDPEQDLLKDADSLSYFETCIDFFIEQALPGWGMETVRKKIDWMYQRIGSETARRLAQPFYQATLARIDVLVEDATEE